ncbi:MAG: hypothetical protein ACK4X1_03935 [Terricaulis sp.]
MAATECNRPLHDERFPVAPFRRPLIVSAALLMETMDATVPATALPTIATTLHAPVLSLKLAPTTYLVALAAFIPISGWMASDGWRGLLAKTAAGSPPR